MANSLMSTMRFISNQVPTNKTPGGKNSSIDGGLNSVVLLAIVSRMSVETSANSAVSRVKAPEGVGENVVSTTLSIPRAFQEIP